MALTDIYLLRWTPWTFVLLIIAMAAWVWWTDRRMKRDTGTGLFERMFD